MKKVIKLLIIFIMLIPMFLYASTYNESRTKAKRYITRDYADTYQRYLIDASKRSSNLPWSFVDSDNTTYSNGDTAFGGSVTE